MRSKTGLTLAGILVGFGASAMVAQQQATRVRGAIESIHGDRVAVKSYDGKTVHLVLQPNTKYAWVVPAKLSDIRKGDFLGTATTGPRGEMRALEVVIFPDSMRGTGEGQYGWAMPEVVVRADSHASGSMNNETMTNGTMTNGTMTNGTMTNGTMTNGAAASNHGRMLTLSYSHGQTASVMVPPGAPVVRFVPAQRSILSPGAKVFIVASGRAGASLANFVAVGRDGLTPPM